MVLAVVVEAGRIHRQVPVPVLGNPAQGAIFEQTGEFLEEQGEILEEKGEILKEDGEILKEEAAKLQVW